jgi:hypothetical protein
MCTLRATTYFCCCELKCNSNESNFRLNNGVGERGVLPRARLIVDDFSSDAAGNVAFGGIPNHHSHTNVTSGALCLPRERNNIDNGIFFRRIESRVEIAGLRALASSNNQRDVSRRRCRSKNTIKKKVEFELIDSYTLILRCINGMRIWRDCSRCPRCQTIETAIVGQLTKRPQHCLLLQTILLLQRLLIDRCLFEPSSSLFTTT